MTAKELKEALANVPDDAEVYMDDGCSVTAIPTVYAVEEHNPETKEWAVLKMFNNRKAAEDEKQTLEMYGKKVKSEKE